MAKKSKNVTKGTCPQCGEPMKAARVPTPEEYAAAFDKENPGILPPGSDTASPEQRERLGPLFRCTNCGYQHRETPGDTEQDAQPTA